MSRAGPLRKNRRVNRSVWSALAAAVVCIGLTGVPADATNPSIPERHAPTTVIAPRATIGAATIGRVAPTGTSMCTNGYVWFQAFMDPVNPTYRVPFAGVVTSVSHFANAGSGRIQAVFLVPTATDFVYTVSHKTSALSLTPNQLNTFPVRIPVQAGEFLALRTVDLNVRCIAPGGTIDQITAAPVADSSSTFGPPTLSNLHQFVNISAVVEPDLDGDGYGDVSQDGCPQLSTVHDPCPAPVTTIKKAPKKRITGHRVKIKFTSNVAGSTFGCSVDGRAFKTCRSPFKGSFLLGTHTVRIQATSPVGVPGAQVTVQFRVVKPERR
jgi:hypothetical protein